MTALKQQDFNLSYSLEAASVAGFAVGPSACAMEFHDDVTQEAVDQLSAASKDALAEGDWEMVDGFGFDDCFSSMASKPA